MNVRSRELSLAIPTVATLRKNASRVKEEWNTASQAWRPIPVSVWESEGCSKPRFIEVHGSLLHHHRGAGETAVRFPPENVRCGEPSIAGINAVDQGAECSTTAKSDRA